ncbi:MAG: nucleoside-diphosphate kinase [Candidatus Marinimicrobia bacterium]|nr:nucleoside-diphosphate kinase [Candidatus Neomarinimicrobiota bacterium]MCF7851286.1 nucleoside-diphosphate kinase [Candidatus Neomarinimicrobiota bacterium]MCF7905221.1 nucleoside-diphosphate kinase [Candidatus Neomarinimicrobiota bacterium]
MSNKTFAMIKPDAVGSGKLGKVIDATLAAGFKIKAGRLTLITEAQAKEFYAVHRERPFYGELVEFMSSGPTFVMALEKENAVQAWRDTIGATDPAEAAEGTIRWLYAENKGRNAVHGSDSDENAQKEIAFFFSEAEIIASNL